MERRASGRAKLESTIRLAAEFHGHLGAFLVVGVRMGSLAQTLLRKRTNDAVRVVRATLRVPLKVPFSCTIDGVQVTTHCTVGNRKLSLEGSSDEIVGSFSTDGSPKVLKVQVRPDIVTELMSKRERGVTNEELAEQVSRMPDSRLFEVEER